MNRRGFLLGMLAAGAAPAVVKAANIMPVFMRRESGLLAPQYMADLIRMATQYDIHRDLMITRFDIYVPSTQLHLYVDQSFTSRAEVEKLGAKELATGLFDNELRHRGLSWANVRPLPRLT